MPTESPCVYDTDGDGDCQHCFNRGGCKNLGGPFKLKGEGTPVSNKKHRDFSEMSEADQLEMVKRGDI